MDISVIMVDGGFREQIDGAKYFSDQDFPENRFEVFWIEYFDKAHPELAGYPSVRTITLGRTGTYHSSHCFNRGILEASGEILVIPDADVMVERSFLSTVYEEHRGDPELVLYFHRLCQSRDAHKALDRTLDTVKATSAIRLYGIENHGGCLSVRKKWLLEIDGYETHEAFAGGNHANGKDVYTRLKNLGLRIKWHPRRFLYHPWHPGTSGEGHDRKRLTWQKSLIQYKGIHLMTTAFEGIKGKCDPKFSPPPPPFGYPEDIQAEEHNDKASPKKNARHRFKRSDRQRSRRLFRR